MSIYSKSSLGWVDNQIKFNEYTTFPVYRVKTRMPVQFQVEEADIPVPFESGINDFQTLIGKTLYVIRGTMYPKDETSYYAGVAALRAACSLDLQQSSIYNVDSGYVPYTWEEGSTTKMMMVKALYVMMSEDTRQGFVQPFTIYLKIKDPIIYGNELKEAVTTSADPAATAGAMEFPVEYPVVIGSTIYTVSSTVTNNGNIQSYPNEIKIYGPINKPKLSNTTTGEYLEVNTNLSSASNILTIKYNNTELLVEVDGVNVAHLVTSGSDYFKLFPGENIITLSGTTVGDGAYASVKYRDSYALA